MLFRHSSRILHTALSGPDRVIPRARLWARPLRIDISLLDFCNLRCPHCGRFASNIEVDRNCLTARDLAPLAPWFKSALYVTLSGWGEPFLNKDLFAIIDLIHAGGATVSLISNGTLIDEDGARRLVGGKPLLLNLSIDAATPEVFEKVRLGARFHEVVTNIDRLVEMKRRANAIFPIVNINMTLMRDTLGEIEGVVKLARRWGVAVVRTQTILFFEDSADRSQAVTNREAQEALARAEPRAREARVELRYVPLGSDLAGLSRDEAEGDLFAPSYESHRHAKGVRAGAQKSDRSGGSVGSDKSGGLDGSGGSAEGGESGGPLRFYCPNLWHHLDVDVFGNVGFCCMSDFGMSKPGNIRDTPLAQLWNHPKMIALRKRLIHGDPPPECRKCWALEPFSRRKTASMWRAEFGPLRQMF